MYWEKKNVHHTHLKSNGYPSKWIILSHVALFAIKRKYILKKHIATG
jgi:hypothetical protein